MVVKRQCSFCAGEIEPGTGLMFVKRDGTVFHFCSGSCRKQQLGLGRVGHRVRWTRAHTLKREQATASASSATARAAPGSVPRTPPVKGTPARERPATPEKAPAVTKPPAATTPPAAPAEPAGAPAAAEAPDPSAAKPAKKPRPAKGKPTERPPGA